MQGLGRPIISCEAHGNKIVAVGNEVYRSPNWLTFTDFLFDYIKFVLTPAWGLSEQAKPESEQHPLMDWLRRIAAFQAAHAQSRQGKTYMAPMIGVVRAYLGLAYDLYLSAHNAELPPQLLKRLRNSRTFEGALYEASVIGTFAKAGFTIEFENEADVTTTHCEFTARHKETGKAFSVEAKSVSSSSKRAGHSVEPPNVRPFLFKALQKRAPHDRIVFIELNRAQAINAHGEPDWAAHVDQQLARAEAGMINGQPVPPAYIFVTNRAFMHALDDAPHVAETGIAHGFKIPEFPQGKGLGSILEAVEARERHLEAYWLLKAMNTRTAIPSSFDDRLPEEIFDIGQPPPLRVGNTYLVPDGSGKEVPGLLYDGCVIENERTAYCTHLLANGRSIIVTVPLSESEIAMYQRSPETFFGVIKHVGKDLNYPMDAYDFLFDANSQTPKERLLELMAGWPGIEAMRSLSQQDLAKRYCARGAEIMWMKHVSKNVNNVAA